MEEPSGTSRREEMLALVEEYGSSLSSFLESLESIVGHDDPESAEQLRGLERDYRSFFDTMRSYVVDAEDALEKGSRK